MRWQNKLTKKELKHIRYATHGSMTLRDFRSLREKQIIWREENDKKGLHPGAAEPCWECKLIARKLGIN